MKKNLFAAISLCSFFLNGCATAISDQKVISNTSTLTRDEIVSIQNRNQIGADTFYTAVAKNGTKYNCQFHGGDYVDLGAIKDSKCEKSK